jgi:hypothetical protein
VRYFSFWSPQNDCSFVILFQKSTLKNDKEGFGLKNTSMEERGYIVKNKFTVSALEPTKNALD